MIILLMLFGKFLIKYSFISILFNFFLTIACLFFTYILINFHFKLTKYYQHLVIKLNVINYPSVVSIYIYKRLTFDTRQGQKQRERTAVKKKKKKIEVVPQRDTAAVKPSQDVYIILYFSQYPPDFLY